MYTNPLLAATKIVISEAAIKALEKGIEIIDNRLEGLVRTMKEEKEINNDNQSEPNT